MSNGSQFANSFPNDAQRIQIKRNFINLFHWHILNYICSHDSLY